MLRLLISTLAILFLSQAAAQPAEERRVALVIGVTDYDAVANLANPREGARRVYEALRATGFEVDAPLDSPTKAELDAALQAFSRRADTADVALLYFAGHGMQQFDDNWLIPRNAALARPSDIVLEGVPLQNVVRLMAGARLRLIFLDACRNNPFSARWPTTMSPADGLAELGENAVPAGTVLAYSAGPRQLAPDNGVFAQALAEHMQQEGLELRQVLDRVRRDVTRATPSLNPTHTIALNTAPFYFRGAPAAANSAPAPAVLTYITPEQAPDARQTPSDVRAPLVRSVDVPRLRDFALFRECEDCPEMVVIPSGTFLMGAPDSSVEDDVPQHYVSIRRFAVGRFEVTSTEWDACLQYSGGCSDQVQGRGRSPVANVSWNDTQVYVRWLNAQAHGGTATVSSAGESGAYRLLTEAEWEYTARAGTATPYSTGASITASQARFQSQSASPVGSFSANAFGLYDMAGNVWEWVLDCYVQRYNGAPADGSARMTEQCTVHVRRGGSWMDIPETLRSWIRGWNDPTFLSHEYGLRVARTL